MSHIPVMIEESLELFSQMHLRTFFDATVGAGGFAKALLTAHPEVERYVACDRDEVALEIARNELREFEKKVSFVHDNFQHLDEVLARQNLDKVDGFFLI